MNTAVLHLPPRVWLRPSLWLGALCLLAVTSPIWSIFLSLFQDYSPSWAHIRQYLLWDYLSGTLLLLFGVGIGAALLGTSLAWITTMLEFPGRRLVEWAVLLPLAIPAYVLAFVYRGMPDLGFFPAVRDWSPYVAVIVIQSLNFYIYVYLFVRASFMQQSLCLLEAGRISGCGPWGCFFRLALPLARLGIVAGIALALMESMNDFGTMNLFGTATLTTGVYRLWNGFGEITTAAQLASMVVICVLLLVGVERWVRARKSYAPRRERQRRLPRYRLSVVQTVLVLAFVLALLTLTTLWPVANLLFWAVQAEDYNWANDFGRPLWHSLSIAAMAVGLLLGICLWLSYAQRWHNEPWLRAMIRLSAVGYAIPGVVLALGVYLTLQGVQNWVQSLWPADGALPNWLSTGIWASSIAALLLAYLVRFVNFGFSSVEAGLGKISRSLDDAARIAGAGPWRVFAMVHWHLLRNSLFAGAILIFVEVIKELPATMLLRPFDYDTLAIRTYQLAADERLAEAAIPALAMVVCGLLAVAVFARLLAEQSTQKERG